MRKFELGQTLIEVLVALSVITLIVTSITIAVVTSLNNAEFVKNQNLATQYAQQGMEIMRFMRNTNYGLFTSLSQKYCLADSCNQIDPTSSSCGPLTLSSCGGNVNGTFDREIDVYNCTYGDPTCLNQCKFGTTVISKVSWADNKCTDRSNPYCHTVNIASCFSSGDIVPTIN